MTLLLIEPRDPLIARDGRPAGLGGSFSTLRFPPPSMLAGAVRTRLGSLEGAFAIEDGALDELLAIEVTGPLLAELDPASGEITGFLVPAPRDAVLFAAGSWAEATVRRLAPIEIPDDCNVDALGSAGLDPIGFDGAPPKEKPLAAPPAFWRWDRFEEWLIDRVDAEPATAAYSLRDGSTVEVARLGLSQIPIESRAHLAIEPGERVGRDGQLFQTAGLRFLAESDPKHKLAPRRFGLALSTSGGTVAGRTLALGPDPQIAPLGGDRRLAHWRPCPQEWPPLPTAVREAIVASGRARLVLATPAYFETGALPEWNGGELPGAPGVTVRIKGACVPRAEIVSGWNLRATNGDNKPRGRAKPTRRLVPAGSVYFVELDGTPQAIERWCDAVWWKPVSDEIQARRDGFGLVALGAWRAAAEEVRP